MLKDYFCSLVVIAIIDEENNTKTNEIRNELKISNTMFNIYSVPAQAIIKMCRVVTCHHFKAKINFFEKNSPVHRISHR